MKPVLLALLVGVCSAHIAFAESIPPAAAKHFYAELFAAEVLSDGAGTTVVPVVRQLAAEHPLSPLTTDFRELLTFFLVNYSGVDSPMLQKHKASAEEASSYLVGVLEKSAQFNSLVLPMIAAVLQSHGTTIDGIAPFAPRSVTLSDSMKVAIRFFYIDGLTTTGSFRGRVCVGVNGLVDEPFDRDPIVEALAFSAINRDIRSPQGTVMGDFTRNLRLMKHLALSKDQEKAVIRAQGAMWRAMSDSDALKTILEQESIRTSKVLGLSLDRQTPPN